MKLQCSGTTQMQCSSQSLIKAPILHSTHSKAELFSGATNSSSLKTLCTPLTQNPGLQGLRSPFLPDHLKYLWLDLAAPMKPSTHTDILVQAPRLELHTVLGAGNSGEHNCIIRLTHNQPFHFRKKNPEKNPSAPLPPEMHPADRQDDKPVVTGFCCRVPLSWHGVTRNWHVPLWLWCCPHKAPDTGECWADLADKGGSRSQWWLRVKFLSQNKKSVTEFIM